MKNCLFVASVRLHRFDMSYRAFASDIQIISLYVHINIYIIEKLRTAGGNPTRQTTFLLGYLPNSEGRFKLYEQTKVLYISIVFCFVRFIHIG